MELHSTAVIQAPTAGRAPSSGSVNEDVWRRNNVSRYAHRVLRPAEVVVLARYGEVLSGRVLEIGCGAGRILGYLVELDGEVHGIDIAPSMVEYCRRAYPGADVELGDMRNLTEVVEGPFDAILIPDNTLDVVEPAQRALTLSAIRSLLSPDGRLIFSSHNLTDVNCDTDPADVGDRVGRFVRRLADLSPVQLVAGVRRLPRRIRNRRRLVSLQQRTDNYALLNDSEGDFGVLHYYVRRDDQERQLVSAGFDLIECRDAEGRVVRAGADGAGAWLYYVASPA